MVVLVGEKRGGNRLDEEFLSPSKNPERLPFFMLFLIFVYLDKRTV